LSFRFAGLCLAGLAALGLAGCGGVPAPVRPYAKGADGAKGAERYEPSVVAGNQASLNAIARPFARYLVAVHRRIHPVYADEILPSLGPFSASESHSESHVTSIELVLSATDGRIVRLGITKASGFAPLDQAALQAAQRAAPFGPAPDKIASPDGNVYIHWDFSRDPARACSTHGARPFKLQHTPDVAAPRQ